MEDQRIIDALDFLYEKGGTKTSFELLDGVVRILIDDEEEYKNWVNSYEYDETDDNGNPVRIWNSKSMR